MPVTTGGPESLASPAASAVDLVDLVPDAGLVLDHRGTVLRAGRRAPALLWRESGDLVGSSVRDLVQPEVWRRLEAQLAAVAGDLSRTTAGFPLTVHRGESKVAVRAWLSGVPEADSLLLWLREEAPHEDRSVRSVRDINDEVLQALATASYAHQRGDARQVTEALERGATAARRILSELGPGPSLLRLPDTPVDLLVPQAGAREVRDEAVRVLVADDDGAVRAQVRAVLAGLEGVDIVGEACDGDQAVEMAMDLDPDLVFVDLSMPGRDGFDVIATLRRDLPTTRLVALSGFSRDQAAVTALRHGATAYIEKGGAVGRFATLLDDLFPERSRRRVRAPERTEDGPRAETGGLVSLYAHELRSPIAAQLMSAELIADTTEDPRLVGLADRVRENAQKMNRLVQGMIDADQVGHGNLNLVVESTDLLAVVERARGGNPHAVDPERVIVRRRTEPVVAGDAFRLQQVLENLLSNAAKFSPSDSPITVEVRASDELAVIDVSDEGPGIAPADRDKLFGRFERLGATVKGIGLGLYLSREIARAHGGDLVVTSGITTGATFRLTVPLFLDPPDPVRI